MSYRQGHPSEGCGYGRPDVRSAGYHFLVGKALAFVAGLAVTLLAARWMSVSAFGTYMLVGGVVLLLGTVSSLGLREVVQRFVPELMSQGRPRGAGRLAFRLLAVRTVALAAAMVLLYLGAPLTANFLAMPDQAAGIRAACPAFATMTLFNFTVLLLETLLQQKQTKWLWLLAAVLRLGLMLAVVGQGEDLTLKAMLTVDAWAFGIAAAGGLGLLARWAMLHVAATEAPLTSKDLLNRMIPFAAYNYLMVLSLGLQGGAVNKIVAAKYLPLAALAGFAFAQALADAVQRNLPNVLLLNLARPALMAGFARTQDSSALAGNANIFFKANLFLLIPVLAWVAACAEPLAAILSGGKYILAGPLLAGLLVLVGLGCHYRRLEFLCHALELTRLLFIGNLGVVVALVPAALLASWIGPWGIVLALCVGCLSRDVLLSIALTRRGVSCGNDWRGLTKLAGSGLGAGLAAWVLTPANGDILTVGSGALVTGLTFLVLARLARPFSPSERDAINGFLPRPVFVW